MQNIDFSSYADSLEAHEWEIMLEMIIGMIIDIIKLSSTAVLELEFLRAGVSLHSCIKVLSYEMYHVLSSIVCLCGPC